MKRKSFLQSTAALVAGSLISTESFANTSSKKVVRFAHLTDIHLKAGSIPESGMVKAFHKAQNLKPGVDFIINGGDIIMDALEADKAKTQAQWDLLNGL